MPKVTLIGSPIPAFVSFCRMSKWNLLAVPPLGSSQSLAVSRATPINRATCAWDLTRAVKPPMAVGG